MTCLCLTQNCLSYQKTLNNWNWQETQLCTRKVWGWRPVNSCHSSWKSSIHLLSGLPHKMFSTSNKPQTWLYLNSFGVQVSTSCWDDQHSFLPPINFHQQNVSFIWPFLTYFYKLWSFCPSSNLTILQTCHITASPF